jgi:hypothetical protein
MLAATLVLLRAILVLFGAIQTLQQSNAQWGKMQETGEQFSRDAQNFAIT